MAKELNLVPSEFTRSIGQCPICEQEFRDKCPPNSDMDNNLICLNCGNSLNVLCTIIIKRTYTITTTYKQEE